ncbi:hypothetical protein BaRGS_00015506, partial [Batillaria attramentaria]
MNATVSNELPPRKQQQISQKNNSKNQQEKTTNQPANNTDLNCKENAYVRKKLGLNESLAGEIHTETGMCSVSCTQPRLRRWR